MAKPLETKKQDEKKQGMKMDESFWSIWRQQRRPVFSKCGSLFEV